VRRSACGGWPKARINERRIRSGSPNPVCAATSSIGSGLLSTRSRAASRRSRSTALAGVVPVSTAKARAKLRGLIAARSASRSTESRSPSRSRAQPRSGANLPSGRSASSNAENCDCPARAAVIDDEMLRRALGDRLAEILGDERQREIDAGGDAGRGPHIAVADKDAVGFDTDLRIGARQFAGARPMGGGAAPVEQPGGGENKGAGADAGDAPGAERGSADKGQCLGACGCLPAAAATSDDQRVERTLGKCVGDQRAAGRAGNRARPARDDAQPIGLRRRGAVPAGLEHAQWPGGIERTGAAVRRGYAGDCARGDPGAGARAQRAGRGAAAAADRSRRRAARGEDGSNLAKSAHTVPG
jgi:hypothetical protein